ncbi:MAG TPA: hypothetical protein VK508_05060 [Cyclobacteriaceae bacterium]|nr:hypothetical protein [Cyclobacteriaceae bacterium]
MIAVLTGDMVSSRSIPNKSRWLRQLQEIIEKRSGLTKTPKWSVFRGDGFQVELPQPSDALRLAVLIRAGLRSMPAFSKLKLDARIAIGIGEKGYTGKSVNESDGQAYLWSGSLLDSLMHENHRLQVNTPWPTIDQPVNVALKLASAIIDDWTFAEAEVVWLKLSEGKTQDQMAKKLKISQPAVHKRYASSHYNELSALISYFESTVSEAVMKPGK